jgi:hypothetical protein
MGGFILVYATFGMAGKEYSTIVTATLDVNFGWLREVRQRLSGRRQDTERDDPTGIVT